MEIAVTGSTGLIGRALVERLRDADHKVLPVIRPSSDNVVGDPIRWDPYHDKIEADAFQRGELMGHEYAVNEITHYELWFDEKEKIAWDFYTNTWRVNGVDENADTNRILRVPATL